MSLGLYERPIDGSAQQLNLDRYLPGWRRSKVANGGYYLGSFRVRDESPSQQDEFYNTWLGKKIIESTFGITSYEGIIWQLDLIKNGINYRRTLKPSLWHNRVKVLYVDASGSPQVIAWSENTDASGYYGEMEYIYAVGETTSDGATGKRDSALTNYAWPLSRTIGGVSIGGAGPDKRGDGLYVTVAGLGVTMNWQYRETSETAAASTLLATLIGETEFISTGRIETNATSMGIGGDPARRIGDLITRIVGDGDDSGNIWKGGVYAGGIFVYEQAPTTVDYELRDGFLYNRGVPVDPALLDPGFYVRDSNAPRGAQPPGTSNIWDDPQVSYCDEVEFRYPDIGILKYPGETQSAALPIILWREGDPEARRPAWIPRGDWMPGKFGVDPYEKARREVYGDIPRGGYGGIFRKRGFG